MCHYETIVLTIKLRGLMVFTWVHKIIFVCQKLTEMDPTTPFQP
jgi:hypothetical protein